MTTEAKHTPKAQSRVDAAIAGWKRCQLTPSQTYTELIRYAKDIEQQRDELAEALRVTASALDAALNSGGDWTEDADTALLEARAALAKVQS